ncbi:MAG: acyl carrier protein [Nitrospirae bacterium]|nr:acyl carrier protein [Nitrospirota bacterium]MBF0536272.1 acyl carrier protein [Nitrospirota bacterium]MBF0615794.1 acyl carrier protein [Nitrospirota bacterium]
MTRKEIMDVVIGIMQDVMTEVDCSTIEDTELPFSNMMEMDSMDFLDVVMALQRKYAIEIPDEDFPHLKSMKSTVDYLEAKLK